MIELKPHHVAAIWYYRSQRERMLQGIGAAYSREMAEQTVQIFGELLANPDTEVKIVEGLDRICRAIEVPCPRQRDACAWRADQFPRQTKDAVCLIRYGLTPGEVYTARELVAKVRREWRRNRFPESHPLFQRISFG